MALFRIPSNFNIGFMRFAHLPFYLFFTMLFLMGLGFWQKGLNWGLDFRGGLMLEFSIKKSFNLQDIRKKLTPLIQKDFSLQEVQGQGNILILRTEHQENPSTLVENLQPILDKDLEIRKIELIGPKVGKELIQNSLWAIAWALIGIMIFVGLRFKWQFSICALAALIHDCLGIMTFFLWSQWEFNEGAIVAILITASYSVNDSVVIFDRLRENLNQWKTGQHFQETPTPLPSIKNAANSSSLLTSHISHSALYTELLNRTLNETLTRTLLTSSTAILALLMLYLFGGKIISHFSLPILIGIGIGAYSSVVIALPLMRWLPRFR